MVDCSIGTPNDPPLPGRDRGAGVLGDRTGLSRLGREPAAARGGGGAGWYGASPWTDRSGPRRLRRHQGVRGLGAAPAPAAHARQGHGAVPGRVLPDLRHGGGAGRLPRRPGAGPDRARRGARPRRHRARGRGTGPLALVQLALESDRGPGGPRGGGGLGAGARRPRVLRRVLRRVHLGRSAPFRPAARQPRASSRCTRSPSARTWPACGSVSTPAIPSWSSSCGPSASTPASWCPAPPRRPGWPRSTTTGTWRSSGTVTASAWPSWPASSATTAVR